MVTTYVTFGQIHTHSVNGKTFDKYCVAVIKRESAVEGRRAAMEMFNMQFFTTYTELPNMEYFPRGLLEVE